MYSIVLATMLTTGTAAPDWGCRGCCGGCWGCHGCWGCCGGCWGCWGGCWGCWGGCWGCCGGCWGCYGCWGGWPAYGWAGAWPYAYSGGCGGCWGCWGGGWPAYGYGGVAVVAPGVVAPAAVAPVTPVVPAQQQQQQQQQQKKSSSLGNAAEVVVKAPLDVQLSVEDRDLPRTAGEQAFRTPELKPGYVYTYNFKARVVRDGKTVAYIKQVRLRAGESATADFTKLAAEGKDSARIIVKLPADARLYVDGTLCPLTSDTRSFTTPELNAGQKYYYSLKAEVVRGGETRTARKRVIVEAGKDVAVEFTELPLQTVSR